MKYIAGIKRLRSFIKRAEAGEELVLGFFGGSITQGSLASSPELCYAYRVFEWFRKEYPNARFHYVNAGIGGTSSHFGVSRVHRDLLMYRPDFVIVDFSVNDEPEEFFKETYEGLIRRIWYADTKPATLLLNNVFYDDGKTAQDIHDSIGQYYGIPNVSIRDTVYRRMCAGEYNRNDITPDGLHPNDVGHGLVAGEIIKAISDIKLAEVMDDYDAIEDNEKPPVTQNRFAFSTRYTIENSRPVLSGFRADASEKEGHLDNFKNGWIGKVVGDRIHFDFNNVRSIAIQYRKTVNKPAPVAVAIVDGGRNNPAPLDANFEEDWGDCLYLQTVLNSSVKADHSLDIEIVSSTKEDKSSFYLVSIITA